MKAKKTAKETITIPKLQKRTFEIEVKGTSPLIMHQFSDKVQQQILDKQTGKAQKGKAPKNPIVDLINCFSVSVQDGAS